MTRPRKALISRADTPYYHITSSCVRRAFLCGVDHYSGKNYEHRRQWVVDSGKVGVPFYLHCPDEPIADFGQFSAFMIVTSVAVKAAPPKMEIVNFDVDTGNATFPNWPG